MTWTLRSKEASLQMLKRMVLWHHHHATYSDMPSYTRSSWGGVAPPGWQSAINMVSQTPATLLNHLVLLILQSEMDNAAIPKYGLPCGTCGTKMRCSITTHPIALLPSWNTTPVDVSTMYAPKWPKPFPTILCTCSNTQTWLCQAILLCLVGSNGLIPLKLHNPTSAPDTNTEPTMWKQQFLWDWLIWPKFSQPEQYVSYLCSRPLQPVWLRI